MQSRLVLRSCASIVAGLTLASAARANEPAVTEQGVPAEPIAEATDSLHTWGVEFETVQPWIPTVNIVRLRGTRTLWGRAEGPRGDIMLGAYIRPGIKHDVLEYIHEYQGSVGYRQYVWRGLHAEAGLDVGAAWGTNKFDGKRYDTATLFLNANIGYRLGFLEPGGFFGDKKSPVGFYAIPQFGVLAGLGVADIGPRDGKPDVFPQGNLFLGVSF